MSINVITDNNLKLTADVSFDISGNVYFDLNKHRDDLKDYLNDSNSDLTYQVDITGNNKPYCDPNTYNIIDSDCYEGYGYIQKDPSYKPEENKEKDDNEYDSDDSDAYHKYYYEEKGYLYTVPNFDDKLDDSWFHFCHLSSMCDIPIHKREFGDILSLYDTYIIKDNAVIFRSKLMHEIPLYILKIYTDHVSFRETCNTSYEHNYMLKLYSDASLNFI